MRIQSEDQAVIAKLEALKPKSIIGRLRPLLPTIDRLLQTGLTRAEILAELHNAEIPVSKLYLDTVIQRYRKKLKSAPIPSHGLAPTNPTSSLSSHQGALPTHPAPGSLVESSSAVPSVHNKGDLARVRRRTPDLNELAQLGKKHRTKL
ncbi:hypothetical protein [Castellaniella sp.]|uniref:hypothetical protein n=1 Tax=Castellaniella sp. TaxID=1955812 RepID=UPI002AFE8922|nr:hypothetical protein [Castellaniella sp.]